jgi:hypothetical protein
MLGRPDPLGLKAFKALRVQRDRKAQSDQRAQLVPKEFKVMLVPPAPPALRVFKAMSDQLVPLVLKEFKVMSDLLVPPGRKVT